MVQIPSGTTQSDNVTSKSASDFLLAIDQGTTSTRAVAFAPTGEQLAVSQKPLQLSYPQDGWVEQDAVAIWNDTKAMCRELINSPLLNESAPLALGITNQRETTIVWSRETGQPVYPAIVWQDRRTAAQCDAFRLAGHEALVANKTGLLLDPYFCATKLAWILENVHGARARAENGELLFGTVDCYLLWHLTEGKVHATDITNASRTLLFNIHERQWDAELLQLFGIPSSLLPQVKPNAFNYGCSSKEVLGKAINITAMIGDQQAALVGQGCISEGDIKSTYGTGCFLLMNTGSKPVVSSQRLLTTIAYQVGHQLHYALEGSIFIAGAAIQWLRDGLKLIGNASESQALAETVSDNGGVYFVPALTGLGAPYWRADARGLLTGIARDTQAGHIMRATLEAQAYQTRDLVQAMLADGARQSAVLRVDGGLVVNPLVCQLLADILQVQVEVPEHAEATVWGAACLAGLQIGLFGSLDDIAAKWRCSKRYSPAITAEEADAKYRGWKQAVARLTLP